MATYFGTTINDSPTAVFKAGAALTAAQGIALAMADGKVALPAAGANVIGVVPISEGPDFAEGDDVTVQIKDVGCMIAGGKVTAGDTGLQLHMEPVNGAFKESRSDQPWLFFYAPKQQLSIFFRRN